MAILAPFGLALVELRAFSMFFWYSYCANRSSPSSALPRSVCRFASANNSVYPRPRLPSFAENPCALHVSHLRIDENLVSCSFSSDEI
jgi:hypothetical protein